MVTSYMKERFKTSIESTARHYINLNLSPSIMIRWNTDFTLKYVTYSSSFAKITQTKGAIPIKLNANYLQNLIVSNTDSFNEILEEAAPLSRWVSSIIPGHKNDLIGIEQTIFGKYGGATLLTINQS
jgi:hypothetical protein